MKKKIEVEIQIPMLPNFILTKGKKAISIAEFTDDELQEIGDEFTKALIKLAKQRRK